jgi:hypothetical protein
MAYWLLLRRRSVTAGVNERGGNAKPKMFVNSSGHIVQPWYGVIRLFGWIIIDANGNDQRYRLGHWFGLRERFWFGHYERLRK